jgi:hypothetical protein
MPVGQSAKDDMKTQSFYDKQPEEAAKLEEGKEKQYDTKF